MRRLAKNRKMDLKIIIRKFKEYKKKKRKVKMTCNKIKIENEANIRHGIEIIGGHPLVSKKNKKQ